MDALIHPHYTDEEIRREVRNFGISDNNGVLHLEEKGSVYNEMVTSMDQGPSWLVMSSARIRREGFVRIAFAEKCISSMPGSIGRCRRTSVVSDRCRSF
jgi:hypothetical protein